MKTTPLIIAVCALAAVAGLGSWLANRSESTTGDPQPLVGKKLLSPDTLQAAEEIQLLGEGGEAEVRLLKKEGQWTLPGYFGLPVDFNKLSTFTRSLLEAEVERHVTSNPESMARLELEKSGVRLLGADKEAWKLQVGSRGSSGGHFIRLNDEEAAYLTPAYLSIDTTGKNWAAKRPLTFEEGDVARVELAVEDEALVFAREASGGQFTGENFPEDWQAKNSEITRLIRTLVNARLSDAVEPDHPDAVAARNAAREVTLQLFDGKRFTLEIGRRPAPSKAEAASGEKTTTASAVFDQEGNMVSPETMAEMTKNNTSETAESSDEEDAKPGPVFISYKSDAPDFVWSGAGDRAALKFPDSVFEQIPETRDDLVEIEAKEPAPADE